MSSIQCVFVGDLAFGDHPKSVGFGFHSRYADGIPESKAAQLLPTGWKPDVFFGNLEFTLAKKTLDDLPVTQRNCRGISGYAEFIRSAGFNVLNLANNHIYQYGREEFDRTLNVLTESGILVAGIRDAPQDASTLDIHGQTICVLGWCARPRQGFSDVPPYWEFDHQRSLQQISAASQSGATVVASIHWGDEFVELPSPEERRIARSMIDAGATLVVGHHPHAVREVEPYRDGLIAYSLGNFICDMTWNEVTRKTVALRVDIADRRIVNWELKVGRIADDYFPRFDEATFEAASVEPQRPGAGDQLTYHALARDALRRHQRLTVRHILRNGLKYPPAIWWHMLKVALAGRIRLRG